MSALPSPEPPESLEPPEPPEPSREHPVVVEGARKSFGRIHAVDGISFHVARAEVFGLLGPNGAGKSTTVEMLEGLTRPDGGGLRVLGMDVRHHASEIKRRIGVQLQTAALYPHLTVAELINLFASFYPHHAPPDQIIDELDLGEKRDSLTRSLSGGQQQRLSVALALVNDPELVFLDEPTTGLDPAARRSLWDLVRDMKAHGRSVLMTTHASTNVRCSSSTSRAWMTPGSLRSGG